MPVPVPRGANGEPMTDERFKIALGCYDGITPSLHFGSNTTVGTSFEIIREAGGAHTWLSAAATHEISSSSTDDDAGGSGALTILVTGLDANYVIISETVTMDGLTPVSTSKSYLRINEAHVVTAGAGETNAGDIYVTEDGGNFTNGVPDDLALVEEKIPATFGRSESTIFTVPAGSTFYTHSVIIFAAAGKTVTFREYHREPVAGITEVHFEGVAQDTEEVIVRGTMEAIEEKTSVWMEAKVDTGSAEVSVAIDGWLIDNDKILRGVGVA